MIDHSIKKILIWDDNAKCIQDEHGDLPASEKPQFSFAYDHLKYYWAEQKIWIKEDDRLISYDLTEDDNKEIEDYFAAQRKRIGIKKLYVDRRGNFVGLLSEKEAKNLIQVDYVPMDVANLVYDFNESTWVKKYYYDNQGNSVETGTKFTTKKKPEGLFYRFDSKKDEWVKKVTKKDIEHLKSQYVTNKSLQLIGQLLKMDDFLPLIQDHYVDDIKIQTLLKTIEAIKTAETLEDIDYYNSL